MSWLRSKPSDLLRAGAEQFEDAPGAGAEIDQKVERPLAQRLVHGGLDLAFGHMERANPVPLGRVRLEVGLGRLGARLLHGFRAGAVAVNGQVGRVEALDNGAGERALGSAVGEAEEHPGALAEAGDEAGFGHELQVPADARLALRQDLGQILDVQLRARKQRQDAQARGLARGAQGRKRVGAGKARI